MYFTQVVKKCNDYSGRAVKKKGHKKVYSVPVLYLQCVTKKLKVLKNIQILLISMISTYHGEEYRIWKLVKDKVTMSSA